MSYPQLFILGFFILLAAVLSGIIFSFGVRYSIVSGMQEALQFYIQKKKEAIEELEAKFGKPDGPVPSAQKWEA